MSRIIFVCTLFYASFVYGEGVPQIADTATSPPSVFSSNPTLELAKLYVSELTKSKESGGFNILFFSKNSPVAHCNIVMSNETDVHFLCDSRKPGSGIAVFSIALLAFSLAKNEDVWWIFADEPE